MTLATPISEAALTAERVVLMAFETVAEWHDKNARLCLLASKDDPRLNEDDRRRAFDAHRHHAACAAAIRLKLIEERRALLRALKEVEDATQAKGETG